MTDQQVRQDLAMEAAETNQAMTMLRQFEITNDTDLAFAGDLVKSVKERWKALEDKRTAVTRPIHEALREVQSWFKPVQDPLKQAETVIKEKISRYMMAQKEANEAAMQAASLAMQNGNGYVAAAEVAMITPPATVAGVSIREVWDFEITNEALIPREFLSVDGTKIQARIWYADTPNKAPLPIPGVRFFLKGQISVRSGA